MFEFGFILFMFIMQWLSIWAGVAKVDKKNTHERSVVFKQTFCTMGLPAIIGLVVAIVFLFTSIPFASIIYVALSVVFAFCGNGIYQKFFVKTNQKKNNRKSGKK